MSDFAPPPAPAVPPAPSDQAVPPAAVPVPGQAPGFGPAAPGFGPAPAAAPATAPAPGFGPPAGYGGYPVAQPVPDNGRPGLAVLAVVGVMLASAAVYAGVIELTNHEIGYLALAVGLVIGLALGRIGGRHPALPVVGVVLALLGVFLGEIAGIALLVHKQGISYGTVFGNPGDLFTAWKDGMDAKSVLFFAIGGAEAFVFTRRASGSTTRRYRGRRT